MGCAGCASPAGEEVIGLVIDGDGEDLLVVSRLGIGKRTAIEEYPTKGRGGQGVMTFRVTDRSGPLAVARAIHSHQEVILISREGIVMRTSAEAISRQGRTTQGVAVMNIEDGDALAAIAQIDLDTPQAPSPPEPGPDDEPDAPAAPDSEPAAEAPAEPEPAGEAEPADEPEPPVAEAELPARRAGEIGDVPDEEMQAAVEAVVSAGAWMPHEDALEAIARELRFRQLWEGIRTPIERAIHQAIRDGLIEEGPSRDLRHTGS